MGSVLPADVQVRETEKVPHSKRKAHIAFLLTDGFAARMMLRSGTVHQLIARGVQVTVISPNADEAYFQQECERGGVSLRKAPPTEAAAKRFRLLRPYFLDDVLGNPALKSKHLRFREKRPVYGLALEMINRTLAKQSLFRKLSTLVELRINRSDRVEELLATLHPDLLVLPNTFGTTSVVYLIHALELGIHVVCQMLSWDNITTKGTQLIAPDYFISWGPIMTEEMVDIYRFPRHKIYECGAPHFDVYSRRQEMTSRDRLVEDLGLCSDRPYIFYGMVAEVYCPNELEILEWLTDHVNRDAFAVPCSLVIRPHPLTISGRYASSSRTLARIKALQGPHVALDIPAVLSEQLAWDLPKQDMYHLASLLAGSAMCLNAGSTLCLDSCMLGRPVINIGFDGREELPYEKSARRALDCFHLKKLFALEGVRIARSFADLEGHINEYLRDPQLDHEGRMRSVMYECGIQDGGAAERVVNTLLGLVAQGRLRCEGASSPGGCITRGGGGAQVVGQC